MSQQTVERSTADVLTVLQERIEQLEEMERDEARAMLLAAASRLAKVAGR